MEYEEIEEKFNFIDTELAVIWEHATPTKRLAIEDAQAFIELLKPIVYGVNFTIDINLSELLDRKAFNVEAS